MSKPSNDHAPAAHLYEHCAEFDLLTSPLTARDARHAVRERLTAWDVSADCIDVVLLLTSEVVTNAARHAPPPVHLLVRHGTPGVRIEVTDSDPTLDLTTRPDLDDFGGRGVWLVQLLSTRWGHAATDGGKVVWFDLEAAPALRPGQQTGG